MVADVKWRDRCHIMEKDTISKLLVALSECKVDYRFAGRSCYCQIHKQASKMFHWPYDNRL